MKKWIKRGLIFFIVVFLVVRFTCPDLFFNYTDLSCIEREEMKANLFNAVVIEKFNDHENHNYPVLVFKSLANNRTYKIFFIHEQRGFFENIQTGDTVKKKKAV